MVPITDGQPTGGRRFTPIQSAGRPDGESERQIKLKPITVAHRPLPKLGAAGFTQPPASLPAAAPARRMPLPPQANKPPMLTPIRGSGGKFALPLGSPAVSRPAPSAPLTFIPPVQPPKPVSLKASMPASHVSSAPLMPSSAFAPSVRPSPLLAPSPPTPPLRAASTTAAGGGTVPALDKSKLEKRGYLLVSEL